MAQASNSGDSTGRGVEVTLECSALPAASSDPNSSDFRVVTNASLSEALSRPTRAEVQIHSTTRLDEAKLIGKPATLTASHGGVVRKWSLVIEAVRYIGLRDRTHRCEVELVHPVAQLTYRSDVRMFREKTLRKIVETVLSPCGISAGEIDWKIDEDPTRDYVIQYRETDLAFLQRILGEEGVNYVCTRKDGKRRGAHRGFDIGSRRQRSRLDSALGWCQGCRRDGLRGRSSRRVGELLDERLRLPEDDDWPRSVPWYELGRDGLV
ncbi:MAG: contractile injection system protein, VgrG/Pvc8 family [Polyangiaceae bacterium]